MKVSVSTQGGRPISFSKQTYPSKAQVASQSTKPSPHQSSPPAQAKARNPSDHGATPINLNPTRRQTEPPLPILCIPPAWGPKKYTGPRALYVLMMSCSPNPEVSEERGTWGRRIFRRTGIAGSGPVPSAAVRYLGFRLPGWRGCRR